MDRLRRTRRHTQGHYCEASRHHRREPYAIRREGEACGNGLCADWLYAARVCRVLPVRDGKVGTSNQTGGPEGGINCARHRKIASINQRIHYGKRSRNSADNRSAPNTMTNMIMSSNDTS